MANLTRARYVPELPSTDATGTVVAAGYSQAAVAHRTVTKRQRLEFDTAPVRYRNSFVKACILEVAVRALDRVAVPLQVADLMCGRGQDHAKLAYAARTPGRIAAYYGMDIAAGNVATAREMAARYLSDVYRVSIDVADLRVPRATHCLPLGDVHLVSCQLAVHYGFESPEALGALLDGVARALHPDGLFLASYADGRAVVRRARAADTLERPDPIVVSEPYFSCTVPRATAYATADASPYGLGYRFSMPGSLQDLPEFLASERELVAQAAKRGLHVGVSLSFDAATEVFRGRRGTAAIAEAMGVLPEYWRDAAAASASNLYRVTVFGKTARALKAWDAAMADVIA